MEIYLVRHTTPDIKKGICYGQSDIDVTDNFIHEAGIIRQHLPTQVAAVHSSPLQRCKKLAEYIFPKHSIELHHELMEINCGHWELQPWDDIPKEEIIPWTDNLMHARIPGGESYTDLYERVNKKFEQLSRQSRPSVIVAHGGVIRSILSGITNTPLKDSFKAFALYYGCVIKLSGSTTGFQYEVLSNIAHEKETHKPSYFQ